MSKAASPSANESSIDQDSKTRLIFDLARDVFRADSEWGCELFGIRRVREIEVVEASEQLTKLHP